ncbi:MAG: pseudouridine synthase [Anaerovoracaceae bacterium]|jgi:23S rRNA pseudouridine2605 synthase
MRLNKYIAAAGVASRREADRITAAGRVRINGTIIREMGYDVQPEDMVEIDGRRISISGKKVYIMLNKPKGYITTVHDEKDRPTVMEFVSDIGERIFPVGRLDADTSGLLIMTNDGELAYRLTHPKHGVYKTYRVRVGGVLSPERLDRLRNGVDLGGFITSKAMVKLVKQMERSAIIEMKIMEGKNRQVRKMLAAVGNRVLDLERTGIGDIRMGHLMPGHYRKLTQKEIEYLKNC